METGQHEQRSLALCYNYVNTHTACKVSGNHVVGHFAG